MTTLSYGAKGPRVKALQRLLTSNKYRNFKPGPIDGEFGPRTGAACSEAKFWLGYSKRDIKPSAGQPLIERLRGTRPLNPAMVVRRRLHIRAEKAAQAARAIRLKALDRARGELGTVESPNGSNRIKYNDWFGWGPVAYCVIFVSWCYAPFSKWPKAGVRWANTDVMLSDAQNGRNGLRIVSDPKPGDPGVIDWEGHTDPDHALIVERVEVENVHTIEGNATDPATGKQGVFRHVRPMRQCWFFRLDS